MFGKALCSTQQKSVTGDKRGQFGNRLEGQQPIPSMSNCHKCSFGVFLYKNFEIDFSWITTFPQCVHGVYDEKMEKIQGKYSRNYGIKEIPREHSTSLCDYK